MKNKIAIGIIVILFCIWWPLGLYALQIYLIIKLVLYIIDKRVTTKYNEISKKENFVNSKLDEIERDMWNAEKAKRNQEP